MGFRFRRSMKVFPGVRINLSRSGLSTSIGVRGAHITLGHSKVRETVGLPGTGISYTTLHKAHQDGQDAAQPPQVEELLPQGKAWRGWLWAALFLAFLAAIVAGTLPR